MSMVSLLMAPFLKGMDNWEQWYFGLAPAFLIIVITAILMFQGIITWKDPLAIVETANNDDKPIDVTTAEETASKPKTSAGSAVTNGSGGSPADGERGRSSKPKNTSPTDANRA
jgi:hypothetical protein